MARFADVLLGRTEAALALAALAAALVFSATSSYFLTPSNAVDLIESYAVTTILAAGVFVVLVSGGIDISFAATAAATQYVGATLATAHGFGPVAAIGSACLMGATMGAINALLTHYLAIWSIIVTIATSSIYYALLIQITGGSEIYNLPDWWVDRVVFFRWTFASGDFIRITLPVVLMMAVVLATHLIMAHSRMGRQVYALGGNPESASRLGINLLGVRLFAYAWLGALAGLAGFVQAHRVGQAVPTAMAGTELDVLAVAILGGAALTGGVGSMGGVMLGVLLLAMLQNGLNLVGVSPYFFDVVIGLAILLSISLTGFAAKRRGRARQGAFG